MNHKSIWFYCWAFLAIACKQNNVDSIPIHDHEASGLEPLAFTLYTPKTELFVEFNPLIVDTKTNFHAHLTSLGETSLPIKKGTVTVSLVVEDKGIRQQVDSPNVSGIFSLGLIPKKAGVGKLIFDIDAITYQDQIVIDNVTVHTNDENALTHQKIVTDAGDITFLKEQAWKVDFATTAVARSTIHDIVKTSGSILAVPGSDRIVSANANGLVQFAKSNMLVGTEINQGSHLITITGGNLSENNLDAKYQEINIQLDKAKKEYTRAESLVKDKLISEASFLQTKVVLDNVQNEYNTFTKNYSSAGQKIIAPMTGYLKNILVHEGEYVETGTPIATITKNKKLLIQAELSQKYMDKIPAITSASFKALASEQLYDLKKLNGKKINQTSQITASSPYIPVIFEIDNIGNLLPGMAIEVFLKTTPIVNTITIPLAALMEEQGSYYVFIQTSGEKFQKRQVKTGITDGQSIQILSGITEGERLVTKGAYQIKIASASGALPEHSHEH